MNKPPIFQAVLMPFILPSAFIFSHEMLACGRYVSPWNMAALAWTGIGFVAASIAWVATRTCWIRHMGVRYLAVEHSGYGQFCRHIYDGHKYAARWVCDACQAMGQHCVPGKGDWTIEHGKVVADTKKWANFGK